MIEAKLIKKSGQSVVVLYWDYETGMRQAKIISLNDLPTGLRIGQTTLISKDILDSGTEYGIEWELLLSEADATMILTDSLRNHGIWTIEDLKSRPSHVVAAINSSSNRIYAELLKRVKVL